MVDFVEICNVCARKATIEAAKRIINSDKVCRSYSDLNFGVTFFGTQCIIIYYGRNGVETRIHIYCHKPWERAVMYSCSNRLRS